MYISNDVNIIRKRVSFRRLWRPESDPFGRKVLVSEQTPGPESRLNFWTPSVNTVRSARGLLGVPLRVRTLSPG